MDQIKEKTTRGIAWSAVGNWGNQITTFVVFIILTRLLGPEAFGLVGMATVFITFVSIFAEQGMGQAIVQRQELEDAHLNAAFWTNLALGTGLTILGVLLSPVVAKLYNEPRLTPVVAWLSIMFLLTALSSTQEALFTRQLNFRALSTRQLIASLTGGFTGIIAALLGAGVYSLVIKTLTTSAIGVVLLWRLSNWTPGFAFSKSHFKELFSFGANMVAVRITNFFSKRLDDLLIGYFLGAQALGYYTVAYRLARLTLEMFTDLLGRVAITTFARLQTEHARLQAAFFKFTYWVCLITFPIFAGMILVAEEIILLFSGEQWLASIRPMQILSIAGFTLTLQYINSYLLISTGRPGQLFRLNLFFTIAIGIGFLLSARYGINQVSMVYSIVCVAFSIIFFLAARQIIRFSWKQYGLQIFRPALACIAMVAAVLLWKGLTAPVVFPLWLKLLLSVGIGGISYFLAIFILQRSIIGELREALLTLLPNGSRFRKHPNQTI